MSFVALTLGLVPPAAAASGPAVPSLTVSIRAVTEAYPTRFVLTARDSATGQVVPVFVRLSNQPADAADNDYYVDYADGAAAASPYGTSAWTDLGPGATGDPFKVDGPTSVTVLAYDNEALGDPDGNDTGQAIGLAVAVVTPNGAPGPWIAVPGVPVVPAMLTARPTTVEIGVPTPVTFRLTDALGHPLAGYSVQPEVQPTPTGTTGPDGTVTLTVEPGSPGPLAFWAEDPADNGHNLAGIEYAGAYPTVTLDAVTVLPKPPPGPPPNPSPPPRPPLVVLARNNLPFDGLVGSVLAVRDQAPLYLTDSRFLTTDTAQALKALGVTHVILLGGTGAITPAVARVLQARGIHTERLFGRDRYGTAAAVALAEGDPSGVAVVADGLTMGSLPAAASVAAAHGWVLLLADGHGVPPVERPLFQRLHVHRVYVVGSAPGLNLAAGWLESVGLSVRRIGGVDPYTAETAWMHALLPHPGFVYVTRTGDTVDSLPLIPAVALHHAVVLTVPNALPLPATLVSGLRAVAASHPRLLALDATDPIAAPVLAALRRVLGGP
jgi:hypothetical protein